MPTPATPTIANPTTPTRIKHKVQTTIDIPAGIRLIVLDMDGTIYSKPHMTSRMLLTQWHHLPFMVHERITRAYRRRQVGKCEAPDRLLRAKWPTLYSRWYKRSYLPSMVKIIGRYYRPQAWLHPLLDECRQRQIPVVILSDYEAVTDKLHILGLKEEMFDGVYATSEAGTLKPDPRLGTYVMEQVYPDAAKRPEWKNVLFVGDRPDTDGALAEALGAQYLRV